MTKEKTTISDPESGQIQNSSRLGIIGVIVERIESAEQVNAALHAHRALIAGRMGLPYRERGLSVISLIVDGPLDSINALTGALGRIPGVSVKMAVTSK